MRDVFISYSHIDSIFLQKLKRHFRPFENRINFWDDTSILPGQKWKDKIEEALNNTKVAILLVSADFFNSDFITKIELPQLLKASNEKGTLILTIILKPCLFDEYPEINKYQALNSPDYTIIQMSEHEQEKIWMRAVKAVKDVLI